MTITTNRPAAGPPAAGGGSPKPLTRIGGPWHTLSWAGPAVWWLLCLLAAGLLVNADPHPRALHAGVLVGALVAGGCGLMLAAGEDFCDQARAYYVGTGAAGAVWTFAAASAGLYNLPAFGTWLVLLAVSVCWYAGMRAAQHKHEQNRRARRARPGEPHVPAQRTVGDARKAKWEAAFAHGGLPGLTVLGHPKDPGDPDGEQVYEQPTRAGFCLHVRAPSDGSVTLSRLDGSRERLEQVFGAVLRKTHGGLRENAIRIERARRRSDGQKITTEFYVHINVRDILAELVPLTEDHTPMSIYDAFTVGYFDDGEPIGLTVHNVHLLIIGATRKGKSNFLHVLLYMLTRCTDAVVWMLDFKGGATAKPWVLPWWKRATDPATGGPLPYPLIDWVAVDRLEGERILLAGVAAAQWRAGETADGKWRATPDRPAIFILADEVAEAVGQAAGPVYPDAVEGATAAEMTKLLNRGVFLGAAGKILYGIASQRGTVGMVGGGDGKSQMGLRVGFPMNTTSDAGELFQKGIDGARAAQMLTELTHPGSCVVFGDHVESKPGRIMFMAGRRDGKPHPGRTENERLEAEEKEFTRRALDAVCHHTQHAPALDDGTAGAVEEYGYSTRWTDKDRTWWLRGHKSPPETLRRWNAGPVDHAPSGQATTLNRPAPVGQTAAERLGLKVSTDPWGATKPATPPPAEMIDGGLTDEEQALWERLEADHAEVPEPDPAQAPSPTGPDSDGYRRFVAIIREAGRGGIAVARIGEKLSREGLAPSSTGTLYNWRDAGIRAGAIERRGKGRNALLYPTTTA